MGGFYQGKGGGKGAAAAAAPAAAGGEELPGGLKRKLQALGYPVSWRTGVCFQKVQTTTKQIYMKRDHRELLSIKL